MEKDTNQILIFRIAFLVTLFISLFHPLTFRFQKKLTNEVVHDGLPPAERLTLGVVRVWGAGSLTIRAVTLRDTTGKEHRLTPQHNAATQVRRVLGCSPFSHCSKFSHNLINAVI